MDTGRWRWWLIAAALALASCSGGGGGGGGGTKDDDPVKPDEQDDNRIEVDLDTANPPWRIAGSNDLALYMGHVHQDYFADPTHFAFWWSVRSTFDVGLPSVEWVVQRIDGKSHPTKTGRITNLPANEMGGDGHNYSVEWTETDPGRHYYVLMIDPERKLDEAATTNNAYVFVVDFPESWVPSRSGDIEFWGREAHFHAMYPDSTYIFHFEARNTTSRRVGRTTWTLTSPDLDIDLDFDLEAMESMEVVTDSQPVKITEPGLHEVVLTIDADDDVDETNENNNARVFPLLIGPPVGSG